MAFVCLCEGVPERDVRQAIFCGAIDVDEVGRICGAGMNCHGCHAAIEDLIDEVIGGTGERFNHDDNSPVVIQFPGQLERAARAVQLRQKLR